MPKAENQPTESNFEFSIAKAAPEKSSSKYMLIAAGAVAVLVVALIIASRSRVQAPQAEAPLTPEQKDYLSKIQVADAKMSAAENFLGQTVYYLNAQLTNSGSKTVKDVTLQLEFLDVLGQVVLRDNVHPIIPPAAPLNPAETRSVQLMFDRMPSGWNQSPPRIAIKSVQF